MARTSFLTMALASAALGVFLGGAALAQARQDQPASGETPQPAPAPSKPEAQTAKPPQPVAATDPNLQVAQVRLEGGYRASKVIGAAVYNGQNQQIGTVDDIILNHQNQADLVVLSVGGFLGVGGKLVALPYGKIERADNGRVLLENASKDQLAQMPSFTYAQ